MGKRIQKATWLDFLGGLEGFSLFAESSALLIGVSFSMSLIIREKKRALNVTRGG